MLGNVESTIYAFSTNKWPQLWPQKQIEWASGNHYSIRETDFLEGPAVEYRIRLSKVAKSIESTKCGRACRSLEEAESQRLSDSRGSD